MTKYINQSLVAAQDNSMFNQIVAPSRSTAHASVSIREDAIRRLSLNLFQQTLQDLSSNNNSRPVVSAFPQVSPSTSYKSTNLLMPRTESASDLVDCDDLDHIFEDDMESKDKPVVLEHARSFLHTASITPPLSEHLFRGLLPSQALGSTPLQW
jgi:hypothetical protein